MSPDVTAISSEMQIVFLKSVQLVVIVITCASYFIVAPICVLFYLPGIHLVVVVYDKSYWS